jgi:hypothetical protein
VCWTRCRDDLQIRYARTNWVCGRQARSPLGIGMPHSARQLVLLLANWYPQSLLCRLGVRLAFFCLSRRQLRHYFDRSRNLRLGRRSDTDRMRLFSIGMRLLSGVGVYSVEPQHCLNEAVSPEGRQVYAETNKSLPRKSLQQDISRRPSGGVPWRAERREIECYNNCVLALKHSPTI